MENKTHFMLIALILLLIIFAATFVQRASAPPAPTSTAPIVIDQTRFIHIVQADWGRNCHGRKQQQSPAVILGITQEGTFDTPSYDVPENNAYDVVTRQCGDKLKCRLEASVDFVGFDSAPGCDKELTVKYRCFSYDSPWIKKAKHNQEIEIDCADNSK